MPAPRLRLDTRRPPRTLVLQSVPETALLPLKEIGPVDVFPNSQRTITKSEILERIGDYEYVFALGEAPLDRDVLESAHRLRFIGMMEIMSMNLDLEAATSLGIGVSNLPNVVTETTADMTMALLLATARRIPEGDRMIRERNWGQYQSMALLGQPVNGKTIGILGAGNVGRAVARRALGFDMRVIYHDRHPLPAVLELDLDMTLCTLEELFTESDFVVSCVTLTQSSRGLINARLLGLMKPTAILINTSRGQVVDEMAVVEAVRSGRIAGAGLDVFEREPPMADPGPIDELLALPNVVVTPHLGTATEEMRTRMASIVTENIVAYHRGLRPPNLLNPELFGEPALPESDRIG